MYLLDTNILIYSSKPGFDYLRDLVTDDNCSVSVISKVETLGFQKISESEISFFTDVFGHLMNYPINNSIIDRAIQIKQSKRLPLGDSLIAATALEYNLELLTRNVKDFQDIKGLIVSNPIL